MGNDQTVLRSSPGRVASQLLALSPTHIGEAARESSTTLELAAARKEVKCCYGHYISQPIAAESLGVFSASSRESV